ncbi:MAG: glutamate-cysteine ligase family protein, partial [Hyphomicrobiales bacterium]|nr:glutamate-cysteine ligase family protein [Hyphomicrobiales bacterium]
QTKTIEEATKIWWDLRPSDRFPTLETRICDVSTLLKDTITIAAIVQAVARMLYRLRCDNQRWRIYDRFLINENRWRAQRYGLAEGLIDFGRGELVPYSDLLDELIELVMPDAEALDSVDELLAAREIVKRGTSADRQRRIFDASLAQRMSTKEALNAVVDGLIADTVEGV